MLKQARNHTDSPRRFAMAVVLAMVLGSLCASPARAVPSDADLKAVEKDLGALGERITRLQDLTDVEIVQDAYGYYVDKAQWHSLADLFAEDATLEIGGKGVFLGRQRVFEYMSVGLGSSGPKTVSCSITSSSSACPPSNRMASPPRCAVSPS